MSEIKAILEELAEVSGNPRKQMEKYLSAGKKVVGSVSYTHLTLPTN